MVALPANHRLAQKRRLGFDDLRGESMFWFERWVDVHIALGDLLSDLVRRTVEVSA